MNLAPKAARAALRERFEARCGPGPRPRCALAPGRVNLMGEHTDYNAGLVLPLAIDLHTAVVFRPRAGARLVVHAADVGAGSVADDEFLIRPGGHPPAKAPGLAWTHYVRGVAAALVRRGVKLRGGDLFIVSDLPQGAGLSSSASLEVAVARALLALAGRALATQDLAFAAQEAEHTYAGVRCGIMDQTVVARARAGHAVLLDCRDLSVRHVPVRLKDWAFAIFDTGVRHELAASEYNRRRHECERAARVLGARTLREAGLDNILARGKGLDPAEHRRVRHILSENVRVAQFAALLGRGDAAALGALLQQSHASLRDDYEVSCEELDFLAARAARRRDGRREPACAGARMTGGGFGGAVVALVRPSGFRALRDRLAREYAATHGRALTGARLVRPSPGACVIAL